MTLWIRRAFRRLVLAAMGGVFFAGPAWAQENAEGTAARKTVDETIDQYVDPVATFAENIIFDPVNIMGHHLPWVLIFLAGTAIFLTVYFKFINFTIFRTAIDTIRRRYTADDSPGEITHFQALTAALSATVGLGNIAGVAVAVGLGGPGATFWMILMGFCGMTTKLCECTLGVRYRFIDENGRAHGGPMYYLSRGLGEHGLGLAGKGLAIFFSFMVVGGALGAGNMFQANQAHSQFATAFGVLGEQGWIFGLIVALLVGAVIIGGIRSIARVTSKLVPFMCGIYVLAALVILLMHLGEIPAAFKTIIVEAFSPTAVGGGLVGVLIQGIRRAAFSNEAGLGSAPIAHAAVKTKFPASEGVVAALGPFVDTVVICTMTALVIVITGTWRVSGEVKTQSTVLMDGAGSSSVVQQLDQGAYLHTRGSKTVDEGGQASKWHEVVGLVDRETYVETQVLGWIKDDDLNDLKGIPVTSLAFREVISWFPKVLSIAVILFAFSTMISWSYYGEQGIVFVFGRNRAIILAYQVFFCLCVIIGSSSSLNSILRLSDAMVFAMVLPNLIGLYILLPVVKKELDRYLAHVKAVDAGAEVK